MARNSKIIIFNKNFYNLKSLKNTVEVFKELADFKIKKNNKSYKILMENIDKKALDIIEDEFSNYVLSEMKNE